MTRRLFCLTVGAVSGAIAKSWDEPSFPDWTSEFTDRLLTDSPWARPMTVAFEFQPEQRRFDSSFQQIELPGGIGLPGSRGPGWPGSPGGRTPRPGGTADAPVSVRTEVYLLTRWSSALPIRQALALSEFGREGLHQPRAAELLTREQNEYIVDVSGFPVNVLPKDIKRFEAELAKSARLFVPRRRAVTPMSVRVPEQGMHLVAAFRFPRFADLDAEEGKLQFSAEAAGIRIDQQFKLKSMVYQGRLEL